MTNPDTSSDPGAPPAPPPGPSGLDVVPASPPAPVRWDAPSPSDGRTSFRRGVIIVSLVPLGFAILLLLIAPRFLEPLWDGRASILSLPPVAGFLAILAGLVAVNLLALRFLRSSTAVGIVVAVTTTIGLFVVILAPAIVLIAVNLSGE